MIETKAGQHTRDDIADEIAYQEMPGETLPVVRTYTSAELDKAYWAGVQITAQKILNGASAEHLCGQAHLELRKLERRK